MEPATTTRETFVPLNRAAIKIGVPIAWLRSEVAANRVPSLKAGRRVLVNPEAVERALLDRTEADRKVVPDAR